MTTALRASWYSASSRGPEWYGGKLAGRGTWVIDNARLNISVIDLGEALHGLLGERRRAAGASALKEGSAR
jgi:hypothetical protein